MTAHRPDKQGRQNPLTNMLTEAIAGALRQAMFCLPGRIVAFDPATQLAQVECGIQRIVKGNPRTIATISSVPVHFAGDGQWYFWHQITPGKTEGLIHFSQRAIDTWIDQGGPVAPHENRVLSVDDAFFVPGVRSRPGAIPNFKNDGAGLGNYDQDTFIHAKNSGDVDITAAANINATAGQDVNITSGANTNIECVQAVVTASASMDVTTPQTTFNGNVLVNGSITWTGTAQAPTGAAAFSGGIENTGGDVTSDGISLKTHVHPENDNGGPTGPPQ